jgi:DNA repair protein RadC
MKLVSPCNEHGREARDFVRSFHPVGIPIPARSVVSPFLLEIAMPVVTQMSNLDLLSALVGENVADNLLQENQGSLYQLFCQSAGVDHRVCESTPVKAWGRVRLRIDAARELVKRGLEEGLRQRDTLSSPQAVRDYFRTAVSPLGYEVFVVLFLDSQNRLIAARECFRGTLTQTSVYPREIVKISLEYNAAGVIFAHNHPSGVAEPSQADTWLTQTLRQALALVDIKVIDHFIIAGRDSLSMAERGLL